MLGPAPVVDLEEELPAPPVPALMPSTMTRPPQPPDAQAMRMITADTESEGVQGICILKYPNSPGRASSLQASAAHGVGGRSDASWPALARAIPRSRRGAQAPPLHLGRDSLPR